MSTPEETRSFTQSFGRGTILVLVKASSNVRSQDELEKLAKLAQMVGQMHTMTVASKVLEVLVGEHDGPTAFCETTVRQSQHNTDIEIYASCMCDDPVSNQLFLQKTLDDTVEIIRRAVTDTLNQLVYDRLKGFTPPPEPSGLSFEQWYKFCAVYASKCECNKYHECVLDALTEKNSVDWIDDGVEVEVAQAVYENPLVQSLRFAHDIAKRHQNPLVGDFGDENNPEGMPPEIADLINRLRATGASVVAMPSNGSPFGDLPFDLELGVPRPSRRRR